MLKNHTPFHDLGPDHFVKRDPARIAAKLAQRIKDLGYDVQYSAAA
jgi:transposase